MAPSLSPSPRRSGKTGTGIPAAAESNRPPPLSGAETFAWWVVAAALCGAAWVLDPFAEAAFDAPKWLCVLAAAVLGGAALLWRSPVPDWRGASTLARRAFAAAAAGTLWVVLAAAVSPHPELAWPSLRQFLLMAAFAVLGASRLLDGTAGRRMFAVFILACATNALLSLAQSGGLALLPIAQIGGRFATGALLGNEGYVALASAMMSAACIACAINARTLNVRLRFALLAGIGLLVIVLNQQKTSAVALATATLLIVAIRWRLRWLLAGMAGLLVLGTASVLAPAVRAATWGALPLSSYQQITTYRLGAWIAAADMVMERPLTGYGPGAFAAEAQRHRLAAEIRLRERLVPPTEASFVHAHQDYLQLAAEAGIPALLLIVGAAVAVLAGLALKAAPTTEQQVVLAISCSGMIAASGWFPMHIPFTACALLLCAGRAWRLVAPQAPTP